MKKLLIVLTVLLLSLQTVALAKTKEIDITKAKGTNQDIILSLIPSPAQRDVDANMTLKALFDTQLDTKQIKKHTIELKRLSDKKRKIKGDTAYIAEEKALTFKPQALLEAGYYEVKYHGLKAASEASRGSKGKKREKIKEIKYRFYVPEVINGYKLPPEPDEKINNSTLLGVDFNHNGVRDDVERWIVIHYAKDPKYPKTKTAIALQYAWASQKILENPTMESKKYLDDALDCESYWADLHTKHLSGFEYVQFRVKHKVFNSPEIKDKIYNTRARINQKFSFNAALSSNIFDGRDKSIDNCQININELGE